MKLLFVRHGKSLANANSTIGEPDTKLAEEGLEQARVTGQDLSGQNVTQSSARRSFVLNKQPK